MAGGLRARIENAPPQAQPRPDPFGRAAQPQMPPAVRPAQRPQPQARPRSLIALLRELAARVPLRRNPAPAARAPEARNASAVSVRAAVFALVMVAGVAALRSATGGGGELTGAEQAPPADELVIDAPMIPVSVPATECAARIGDVKVYNDAQTNDLAHALVVQLDIDTAGCGNQFVRSAVWVYQAENVPLMVPDGNPVYRSPIGQLSAQTLARVEGSEAALRQGLAIPHSQFPIAVNVPQWLTIGIQVWPEGRPADAGSMVVQQVYFTRVE